MAWAADPARVHNTCGNREMLMFDFVSILAMVAMFLLGSLYVGGCDRLKGERP